MSDILMNETGALPVGITVDGVVHCDFELRPQTVRDSIEALADPKADNSGYFGLMLLAKQVVRLGDLSADKITADLLLDAYEVDMQVLMEGAANLRNRLKTFRVSSQVAAAVASSPA